MSEIRLSQVAPAQGFAEVANERGLRKLREAATVPEHSKIEKSARDFESILIGQWMEDAEKSFATLPGADPEHDADPGQGQFRSLAMQFLASGLSKRGGLGIARLVERQMEAQVAPKGQTNRR